MMRLLCVTALGLMLTGCGETAYKMGAGGDQFLADKRSCANTDEEGLKACMRSKGWTMMGLDTLRPAPTALERDEVAQIEAAKTPVAQADSASMPAAPAAPKSETTKTTESNPGMAEKHSAAKPAPDPNGKIMVGSWWKFGTTNFKADADSCTAKLGPEHRYDETNKTATRAFAKCMRDLKWYAY